MPYENAALHAEPYGLTGRIVHYLVDALVFRSLDGDDMREECAVRLCDDKCPVFPSSGPQPSGCVETQRIDILDSPDDFIYSLSFVVYSYQSIAPSAYVKVAMAVLRNGFYAVVVACIVQ